jgi:dihydrofolate synthase / folylpolyglutamate synthase
VVDASRDWADYLDGLAVFGMRPGLERVTALLDALGRPQDRFRVVHVVGTNGKSSTTRYVAALLRAHGLRAGAYLSPHITGYCERVLVDGRPVTAEVFGDAVVRVRAAIARLPDELGETTQFEVLTVAALLTLAESGVEAVALEAGLGGRLDATNVAVAPVVVLTNIALEHTAVLGDTRAAIFAEKAAVIKGGDAVFGPLDGLEEAADAACARVGARAWLAGRDFVVEGEPGAFSVRMADACYGALAVTSPAAYQVVNAGLAVAAAHLLLGGLDERRARRALRDVAVPGRLQVVSRAPLLLADGAHNPAGVQALVGALARLDVPRPLVLVAAIMRDKDAAGMLGGLLPVADAVVCTQASAPRSLSAGELRSVVAAVVGTMPCGAGTRGAPADAVEVLAEADPARAVAAARELAGPGGAILVTGSLYLLEDLAGMLGGAAATQDRV